MSREIGTLVVVVLKARNLRDKHTIHKQDVFAQATLNKSTKKTKTDVRGGQHPVWDEELRFSVVKAVSDETRKLEVACYAKEPKYDDLIGSGSVDISETLKTGEFDDWVPLKTEDGGYRGDLFLEMTYYSAAPPPQRRPSKWKPSDRLKRPSSVYTYSLEAGAISNDHTTPVPIGANKLDVLPPLPEEPVSASFIPASLRPGGAGPPKTSPKAGSGLLPPEHPVPTQAPLRESSLPAPTSRTDYIPPTLRLSAGASLPVPLYLSTLPSPQPPQTVFRDSSPYRDPLLTPHPYSGARPPEHHSTLPAQPPEPPSPTRDSLPPYLLPGGGAPQPSVPVPLIPEPEIPVPDIPYNSAPPRPYSGYNTPSRGPLSEYGSSPHPSFGEYGPSPAPRPSYGEYESPPRGYNAAPPPMYPPQPQVPAQPQPQRYPSFGNGYPSTNAPPPQHDLGLPDPYLQARYQSPLPLPDEARVGRTPTPSHLFSQAPPHPQVHTQPQPQPQLQPQSPPREARAAAPLKTPAQPRSLSREERDRQLALELEKEEAERRRILREQEERDMELARQLDLELNLDGEAGGTSTAAAHSAASETRLNAGSANTAGMPGEW